MNQVFEYLHLSQIPYLEIYHRLGYPSAAEVREKELTMIQAMVQKAMQLWEPKAIVKDQNIVTLNDHEICCPAFTIQSHDLAMRFKQAKKISLIAVTAGQKGIDFKEKLAQQNEMSSSVILDAVLSEITDSLADEIQKLLTREAALKGFTLTHRYSPGYGDLDLNYQKVILNFLEASKIGISLNSSLLMIPEKSVTALIGWIKK